MNELLLGSFGGTVMNAAIRAAESRAPVLICGETGCGKTVLANLIHQSSTRARKPFIRADCASIPEGLFEREMFGHTRGSFTDAKESQPGLFEAVDSGTLFLDEIGELPLAGQAKLLSVLDDGLVRRIGSTKNISVDVRIIAATNQDLSAMVKAKMFRVDLYYRLAFFKIEIPPLRDRSSVIPELAVSILRKLAPMQELKANVLPELHPETISLLQAYPWPGNIRELEQVLTFAVTFFPSAVVLPGHLPREVNYGQPPVLIDGGDRASRVRYVPPDDPESERRLVMEALTHCGGNRTKAAKLLGMSRATLWVKLRCLGLNLNGSLSRVASIKPTDC